MSRVEGAESTRADTSDLTKAVVAIWVVLVALAAVGAVGVPVNVGEFLVAYMAEAESFLRKSFKVPPEADK